MLSDDIGFLTIHTYHALDNIILFINLLVTEWKTEEENGCAESPEGPRHQHSLIKLAHGKDSDGGQSHEGRSKHEKDDGDDLVAGEGNTDQNAWN